MATKKTNSKPGLKSRDGNPGQRTGGHGLSGLLPKPCHGTEHLVYLTDDELDPKETALLDKHLAGCETCRSLRASIMQMRQAILEAGPMAAEDHPDVSASVLGSLPGSHGDRSGTGALPPARVTGISGSSLFRTLRWISAVAAGLFLVLFIHEQVRSVEMISSLESRFAGLNYAETPGLIDQWTVSRSRLLSEGPSALPGIQEISTAGLGPFKISKVINLKREYEHILKKISVNKKSVFSRAQDRDLLIRYNIEHKSSMQ